MKMAMVLLCFLHLLLLVYSAPFTEFVYPEFNASSLKFMERSAGAFLFSRNGAFKASILDPGAAQHQRFYFCVIHVESGTIIWSANRNSPVSKMGTVGLTSSGMTVNEENEAVKWSTPPLTSSVHALQLTGMGNLLLLGRSNETLWESFQNPTDTIVVGQRLRLGTHALVSAVSSDDLSEGGYALVLTASDVALQWRRRYTYWKLSMVAKTFKNSNHAVEYMTVNQTGLYLLGRNGSEVVSKVVLPKSKFRTAKIDHSGRFVITSFPGAGQQLHEFVGPADSCRIANICGKIGLCSHTHSANGHLCSCPLGFWATPSHDHKINCLPIDPSLSLPVSCNHSTGQSSPSNVSYLQLNDHVDYFGNDFEIPVKTGVNLSLCQDTCSNDCTCLGIFYDNSSGSCFLHQTDIGSVISNPGGKTRVGFIKTMAKTSENVEDAEETGYSTIAVVLFVLSSLFYLFVVWFLLWRRFSLPNRRKGMDSARYSAGELEFSIPGLPARFSYQLLKTATEGFMTPIGTGGFGTVYKGVLPDKSVVAVKKINFLSSRGTKDFISEIATIGTIYHVNLVKLRGYCTQRGERMLVYEYMSRGSLDKTLFGDSTHVLDWQQRVGIAIGVARGLAYLHSGNERRIIHCDVKPENILLDHDFKAKISDFGLSKLLSPDQSSLLTTMRGTRGYLAPEWLTSSSVSDKTDVYSFGMVLLELVSGRKNCPKRAQTERENIYFPLYALEMHEEKRYLELLDQKLAGGVGEEEVERLVRVALCCVHEEPRLRLGMVSVVRMLEGEMPVGEPIVESLNFLRFYGRRFEQNSARVESDGGPELEGQLDASSHAVDVDDSSYVASPHRVSDPR